MLDVIELDADTRRSSRLVLTTPVLRGCSHLAKRLDCPFSVEARQALLAGEQFLHGALFEVALLGEELLQGFDEGIRIAQRLGDGFLFGFGGGGWKVEFEALDRRSG